MKTLPYDVARCTGRLDSTADSAICPERNICQRYLAFTQWHDAADVPDYRGIPVVMAVPACRIKIEVTA